MNYDVVVIGGGISGLGVAEQCVAAKLRVLLLERGALCQGASGNSLRIVHGGFRYLQNFNLARSIRSLRAQAEVQRRFADAVEPLECVLPLQRSGLKSWYPAAVGAGIYRALGAVIGAPTVAAVSELTPDDPLTSAGLCPHGALLWNDALIQAPEKIVQQLRMNILQGGGEVHEHALVQGVQLTTEGAVVQSATGEFRSRYLINCAGASIYEVRSLIQNTPAIPQFGWSMACNLIVRKQLPRKCGIGISGQGGQVFFFVPRGSDTAIGTWYTPHTRTAPAAETIEQFYQALSAVRLPIAFSREEIVGVEWGVLPADPHSGELIGSEQIFRSGPYVEVLSTKWTTFLPQARAVLAQLDIDN